MPLEDDLNQALDEAERFALGPEPPPGETLSLDAEDPRRLLLAEAQIRVALDFVRRIAREIDHSGSVGGSDGKR